MLGGLVDGPEGNKETTIIESSTISQWKMGERTKLP